ncbi:hypothetical protein [Labrys sp. ZIDIC5]|uniref:hypothetical protein n=1 Tax=Labrys sedimenti TaxID=3106036 RepID=UPI002ACAE93E|nr:hypothetical protein [Labrys sp. ZIDIC5]MDZ5454219.1 hypothetical protein [Labrys sp. ZIDIC5]
MSRDAPVQAFRQISALAAKSHDKGCLRSRPATGGKAMTFFADFSTRSKIVDDEVPFVGDPAYETLDGPAAIAYRRAGGVFFDILVIASIPAIIALNLLVSPAPHAKDTTGFTSVATAAVSSPPHRISLPSTEAAKAPCALAI